MSRLPAVNPWRALAARPGFLIRRRLHQIHLALFAEESAAFGVTRVQFSMLSVLAARSRLDQAGLAHAVDVDRATTANVVARLDKRGLLHRRPDATDKRVEQVELTQAGHRLLARIDPYARRARAVEALLRLTGPVSLRCCAGWWMPETPTDVAVAAGRTSARVPAKWPVDLA